MYKISSKWILAAWYKDFIVYNILFSNLNSSSGGGGGGGGAGLGATNMKHIEKLTEENNSGH